MASFKNEYSFVIAEVNAIFEPSGDQIGPASVPFCVTRARTLPSATATTEMSAVPPLALVEGDLAAVRRPAEGADREGAARQAPRLRRGDVEHPQVRHPVALADHVELAELLL